MLIRRRHLLAAAGASTLAAPALIRPANAQAKQINLAGASYDMREAILGEFGKRTGITPRPFVNPSTQVRVDRLRTAPVDCVLLDAPFAAYANSEKLLQPIDISRLPNWSKLNALLKDGRATPTAPLGYRRQPRPHDVSRRGAHQGVVRADVLPDGLDRLQRLARSRPRTTRCRGASCSIPNGAARWRCSASTGWAC